MDKKVAKVYGNKVRVRACGLCVENGALLLVNHRGITDGDFWAPPGGGVEFGDSIEDTLIKEFLEETGLVIKPENFLFGCEYIKDPIHSIELFYKVAVMGGSLKTGSDPEIQIIDKVQFIDFKKVKTFRPEEVHGIFRFARSLNDLETIRGFYRI
jgi:8-oxo-dGTP diphosphatase